MSALIHAYDWLSTPMGDPAHWREALHTLISGCSPRRPKARHSRPTAA